MIQPNRIGNVTRCSSKISTLIIYRYAHSKKTHYDTLNLKLNCTNDEIRQAFAKLSKEHHPDTSKTMNTEKSSRKFQEIMEAYRVLNKKTSRDAYDAEIFTRTERGRDYTKNFYQTYGDTDYEMMRRYRAGEYHRNGQYGPYDNPFGPYSHGPFNERNRNTWNSNPFPLLNRKRVFSFLIGFAFLNFMTMFFIYNTTSRNRVVRNNVRDSYGRPRIGAHGQTYSGSTYSKTYSTDDDPVIE